MIGWLIYLFLSFWTTVYWADAIPTDASPFSAKETGSQPSSPLKLSNGYHPSSVISEQPEIRPSRPSELSTACHYFSVNSADSPASVLTTEQPESRSTSPSELSTAFYQASIVLADSSITEIDGQFRVECL